MKYIILFLPILTFAQKKTWDPIYEDGKITFSNVVLLDSSYTNIILYENALRWVADATNHYNSQIANRKTWELKDNITIKDSDELFANLRMFNSQSINTTLISYDAIIYVKDGRYKFILTNFNVLASSLANAIAGQQLPLGTPLEKWDVPRFAPFLKKFKESLTQVIERIEKNMSFKKPSKDF